MKTIILGAMWIISMGVALLFGTTFRHEIQAQPQDDLMMPCVEQGGTWLSERQECHRTIRFNVDIDYPLELTEPNLFLWIEVEMFLEESIDNFFNGWLGGSDRPSYDFWGVGWSLTVDHTIYQHSDEIVSLALLVDSIPGPRDEVPESLTHMETIVFNQVTNTRLTWDDLFRDDVDPMATIAPLAEADLLAQLSAYDDDPRIFSIDDPTSDFTFALSADELILFYWSFAMTVDYIAMETAPILEVHIPLSALTDILDPMFINEG